MVRYTYFGCFFIHNLNKGKQLRNIFNIFCIAVLCFFVWCHPIRKTNRESIHHLFVFQLTIIRKHRWHLYQSLMLCVLHSSYKTLTKGETFLWSVFPLLCGETEIRNSKSSPNHNSLHNFVLASQVKARALRSTVTVTAPKHPVEESCSIIRLLWNA